MICGMIHCSKDNPAADDQTAGRRGFTLIELMIVVAIIGILAAVAVPKFAEMIRKSKEGSSKGSLSALRSALTIYMSDNEGLQPISRSVATLGQLTVAMIPKYIESFPVSKLGTYHSDSNAVAFYTMVNPFDGNRSSAVAGALAITGADANGWIYTSGSDSAFWTNCAHTDTKNERITTW